jgi:hypothetical protein
VKRVGARSFRLSPYPFAEPNLKFKFPARYVEGETFRSSEDLREKLDGAAVVEIEVSVTG